VTRPKSVKPDNLFLLLFNAVRYRRIPLTLRIASHSLLLVSLALLICAWVMGMQFNNAMQQQAQAIGQSLVTQTAASATELLVANDTLSLNVLLSNLEKNPLVAHAAIYSVDNRILAEAGSRPKRDFLGETDGLFTRPITFQEVIAGNLRISLDMQQFNKPMNISLQSMGLLGGILLILSLYLSLRLGRNLSTPLLQLRVWLRDPDDPAPGAGRQDEIGDIARHLQNLLVEPAEEPELHADNNFTADDDEHDAGFDEDDDEPTFKTRNLHDDRFDSLEDDDEPDGSHLYPAQEEDPFSDLRAEAEAMAPRVVPRAATRSALLAIQLGAQDQLQRLPLARRIDLLKRYRDCLKQAASLYEGTLHTLNDGGSLIAFDNLRSGEDYLTHAMCCGELMRALGHALQIEVADSGITLQLQFGLTIGENLSQLNQADLLLSETAHNALALCQHSRNLLLVEGAVAEDALICQRARIRSIASPPGASCVERLLDPYPALLERQLSRLHENRH
jgi:uncharacterized membrane protein affecting hemolysin expression